MISDNKITQSIKLYTSQELEIFPKTIGSGGSALVHTAKWMKTTTIYAIKRFRNSSRDGIINEV
jgi:hypothetical protein